MAHESADNEVPLQVWGSGDEPSKARLRDGVVLREAGPWSGAVLGLLRHLEDRGFAGAPRVVGDGVGPDGREQVTYVDGESPHPYAWDSADQLHALGRLLRDAHRATAGYISPADSAWKPWFGRALSGDLPVIGHCDTAPWNVLARDGVPVALIDWEYAGPVDALWELAHTAWLNAQLHDDDTADRLGLPAAPVRAKQVRALLDGYELPAGYRAGFVDAMVEFAVHSAAQEAIDNRVTPDSRSAVTETGFPVLWALAWRSRDASWILHNRQLLHREVTGA